MATLNAGAATARVRDARDFLLAHREDYDDGLPRVPLAGARASSTGRSTGSTRSPPTAASGRRCGSSRRTAARRRRTFAELSARSNQVANWLREQGVARGDRMIVMLGNQVELWETILAAMKLGAVIIPATPLLGPADLVDRVERGDARHVVVSARDAAKFDDVPGDYTRIAVGEPVAGWLRYARRRPAATAFAPDGPTAGLRPAAPVLHVRHDRQAQAGRAHPRLLSRRAPVDDVLDRAAAGRRPPQRLLAGLGQARVEQRLRAVARRGDA